MPLVVKTSRIRNATSGDIGVYDSFVTDAANGVQALVDLNTSWRVIGSTDAVDARDHTGTHPGAAIQHPIYNTNGDKVADGYAELWDGSLDESLRWDETGAFILSATTRAHTGTETDGTGATLSGNPATFGNFNVKVGMVSSTGNTWVASSALFGSQQFRFYAISDPITVVPEPGTASLLGLGVVALGTWRRRRGS